MYGLVIYAGHDTKLVQNSGTYRITLLLHIYNIITRIGEILYPFFAPPGRTKFKRTHLDRQMNYFVLMVSSCILYVTCTWRIE